MATDIIRRPARSSPWRNPAVRGIVFQVLFVAAVLALGAFLVHNTVVNLRRQNIASGFGFLDREAAFGIGESLIS
jgi:general L-amino acid transport system permease protein